MAGEAAGQQIKMTTCDGEADGKGLGEGKTFIKECLSAKPVKSGITAQQEKMRAGNKEAGEKSLKGDEWKKFMSTCPSN